MHFYERSGSAISAVITMTKIKLINPDTILPELKPLDWDVIINERPYYVARIPDFVHSIGGRFNENDYWAYPRDEKPCYDNLIEYTADSPVCWGISYNPYHYTKTKWDETTVRTTPGVNILRNGHVFYTVCGVHKALSILDEINEHPLDLNAIDFNLKCVGRKVWWRSEPAVIKRYVDRQACVILAPDGIERFTVPAEFAEEDPNYYEDEIVKTSIFDKHIWWFRD